MEETTIDYSQTIIYKLCCKDPLITDVYVGHTKNFKQRKNTHKTSCCNETSPNYNRYVYKYIRENGGWDNWSMIQIKEHNCKNKREAESTEQYWIEQLGATLNTNKPYSMCKEDEKTYKKIWYEEKKDYILDKAKQNYEENKEQKEYREKNKEKLSEQKKVYRELHKEEAKEKQKAWREVNKEKIKQQKSQIINCECGCQYTFGNKHRHLTSKIHTDFIEQQT